MNVFLSASVPLPERDPKFFDTADVLAIREAVKALVEFVLPTGTITSGGHPAITPLLAHFVIDGGLDRRNLTIFQSRAFSNVLPEENRFFGDIRFVDEVRDDKDASLAIMRNQMLRSRQFDAAVLIGGMEGVIAEAKLFAEISPDAKILPVATTGAAAREFFLNGNYPRIYDRERTYASLFRRHLSRR